MKGVLFLAIAVIIMAVSQQSRAQQIPGSELDYNKPYTGCDSGTLFRKNNPFKDTTWTNVVTTVIRKDAKGLITQRLLYNKANSLTLTWYVTRDSNELATDLTAFPAGKTTPNGQQLFTYDSFKRLRSAVLKTLDFQQNLIVTSIDSFYYNSHGWNDSTWSASKTASVMTFDSLGNLLTRIYYNWRAKDSVYIQTKRLTYGYDANSRWTEYKQEVNTDTGWVLTSYSTLVYKPNGELYISTTQAYTAGPSPDPIAVDSFSNRFDYRSWNIFPDTFLYVENKCYRSSPVSARTAISPIQLKLYPNPARDVLQISVPGLFSGSSLFVSDISGRVVIEQNASGLNQFINVSGLQPGMYIVQLIGSDGRAYYGKFLKR